MIRPLVIAVVACLLLDPEPVSSNQPVSSVTLQVQPGLKQILSMETPVAAIAVSPDGTTVVACSEASVVLVPIGDPEHATTVPCRLKRVFAAEYRNDGKVLLLAGGSVGTSAAVELFDASITAPLSSDARLVSLAESCSAEDVVTDATWSVDGRQLAIVTHDGHTVWLEFADPELGAHATISRSETVLGHSKGLTAVLTFQQEGREQLLTSSLDQTLRVWSPEQFADANGRPIPRRTLHQHTNAVLELAGRPASSPESRFEVASVSEDHTVRLWQPATGRMMRFCRLTVTPTCVVWLADGSAIVAGDEHGMLTLIDPVTAQIIDQIQATDDWVNCLAAVPGTSLVVAGSSNGQLTLTDFQTRR